MNPLAIPPKQIRLAQVALGMIGAQPSPKLLVVANSPDYAEISRLEDTIKPYLGLGVTAVCDAVERHTREYRITCSDPIPPSTPFHSSSARPTRYEPHVGRKQLSKKNGTR